MSLKRTAVSNSGPLIHLGRTTCLELLFVLFDNILIPRKVYEEVVERGMEQGAPVALCVKELVDQGKIAVQQPKSSFKIDHSARIAIRRDQRIPIPNSAIPLGHIQKRLAEAGQEDGCTD